MSKDERGDAAWCRKTAVQSVALLCRLQQLLRETGAPGGGDKDPDPEAEIKAAEREASKLLERIGAKCCLIGARSRRASPSSPSSPCGRIAWGGDS
ncbi:hypothetical protein SNK04_014036 [Fusarium graminearum]